MLRIIESSKKDFTRFQRTWACSFIVMGSAPANDLPAKTEIVVWCMARFGEQGEHCRWQTLYWSQVDSLMLFENLSDAFEFKLRWL
jgi:hypothetical protein